jgi:hypothetical protein
MVCNDWTRTMQRYEPEISSHVGYITDGDGFQAICDMLTADIMLEKCRPEKLPIPDIDRGKGT